MSNFLLTTDEDYFTIEHEGQEYRFDFSNCMDYESSLTKTLTTFLEALPDITLSIDSRNRFKFVSQSNKSFKIIEATHRAKLLLGLYHTQLPIISNWDIETRLQAVIAPSPPITNYANKLYLVSLQGQAVHSIKDGLEYTPSVACSIDSFVKSGLPLIKDFDLNPIKTVVQASDLSRSSMTLVDFQFEPVVLLSPLFITLKIKPVKKYSVGVHKD